MICKVKHFFELLKKNNLSVMLISPFIAAAFPYFASEMCNTPNQGIFSLDVLLLLFLFALPRKSIVWNSVWILVLFGVSFYYENTFQVSCGLIHFDQWSDFYTFGLWFVFLLTINFIPERKKFNIAAFALFSSILILMDWSHLFFVSFNMTLVELFNISKFFIWGLLLFILVPVLQTVLTTVMARSCFVKSNDNEYRIFCIAVLLVVLLFNWLFSSAFMGRVQFLNFGTKAYFSIFDNEKYISEQHFLQENIKEAYPVCTDTTFKNPMKNYDKIVVVLVESWGVSKNIQLDSALFSIFSENNVNFKGLLERKAAYTQAAEWEDFGMPNGDKNSMTVPERYQAAGYQTWYVYGYDSAFFERDQSYPKLGFDTLLFRGDFIRKGLASCKYGYPGICDSSMSDWLSSLLSRPNKMFVYWTTLDAHYPYDLQNFEVRSPLCDKFNLSKCECVFYTHQEMSLKAVSNLAKKFPDVKFVVHGDHRPMATIGTKDLSANFYYGWVSAIDLN